jgi:ferredoxin
MKETDFMRAGWIVLCCFSGTGNTELVARRMAAVFDAAGIGVDPCRIGRDPFPGLPADGALGLAFPVAYLSTYPFVWDFIDRLPAGAGREAFMVDTLGGASGAIVGPLKKLLSKKGYVPMGAREIRMPMNFGGACGRGEGNRARITEGLEQADAYADDLISGASRWRRIPLLSDLMFLCHSALVVLLFSRWNQRRFSMRADAASCSGCGECASQCPAGNIRMVAGPGEGPMRPGFGERCVFCLRCMTVCPNDAIRSPLCGGGRYRAANFAGQTVAEPSDGSADVS